MASHENHQKQYALKSKPHWSFPCSFSLMRSFIFDQPVRGAECREDRRTGILETKEQTRTEVTDIYLTPFSRGVREGRVAQPSRFGVCIRLPDKGCPILA